MHAFRGSRGSHDLAYFGDPILVSFAGADPGFDQGGPRS